MCLLHQELNDTLDQRLTKFDVDTDAKERELSNLKYQKQVGLKPRSTRDDECWYTLDVLFWGRDEDTYQN